MHVGQTFGPFTIEKELGSGAMGTVYRATFHEDGRSDRDVALKVIAFGLSGNESALARFEREAKILKQLKHANIVRLLATGRFKGTPFFAMEYVDGKSLDKVMLDRQAGVPTRPPFTWEEVVELGRPLCAALQHAHEKGIIHRDLKPSNLMVTTEGILKLTDFGIAKDVDVTALTAANNTIGTAAYMSPEQCKGERLLTGKSDLYSLGIVFYELLTGRKPFNAESSVDMFLLHVSGTFTRPAQINPDIPVWLDTLVCQMMEKKPEHRPRDAAMVCQALEEIAEKVASQVSAGADLAKARTLVDRHLGDEDRQAAKFIRAGSKKKKLRKKRIPFYRRNWFVALACLAILGAMGWTVWTFAIAPPSAESLLARIEATKDPEARERLVGEYLRHYEGRDDDQTKHVKELQRELKVNERARVMLNRHGSSKFRTIPLEGDDPDAYQKTMAALTAEDAGNLPLARSTWAELVDKYAHDANETRALWGWHAQRKLYDLAAPERDVARLHKRLDEEFRLEDKDARFEDDTEKEVVAALRLQELGDFARAQARWSHVAETLQGAADRRPYYVYAKGRVRDLDAKKEVPNGDEQRADLIRKTLDRAKLLIKETTPARQRDGRNLLRDIRDLYAGDQGEVGQLVNEAKKLLESSK
ncbi:MAG TPA: serine/threonine-protein kinase [Gemmataceae bacterium]|nr:serine/threonine-protein kinase [Gemmataceae bacterium]